MVNHSDMLKFCRILLSLPVLLFFCLPVFASTPLSGASPIAAYYDSSSVKSINPGLPNFGPMANITDDPVLMEIEYALKMRWTLDWCEIYVLKGQRKMFAAAWNDVLRDLLPADVVICSPITTIEDTISIRVRVVKGETSSDFALILKKEDDGYYIAAMDSAD